MIPPKQEKSIAVIQNTPNNKTNYIKHLAKRGAKDFLEDLSKMDETSKILVLEEILQSINKAEYTVGTPIIIYAEDKSDVIHKAHDAIKHIHDRGDYDEVHNIVITSYARIHSNIVIEELSMCNITVPTTTPKSFNRQ